MSKKLEFSAFVRKFSNAYCGDLIHFIFPLIKFRWWSGSWSRCTTSCGPGTQKRPVYCIENGDHLLDFNLQNYKIDDQFCFKERRPDSVRKCAVEKCPKPKTGEKNGRDTSSTSETNRR